MAHCFLLAGYEFEETYIQEDDEPPSKLITDGKQKLIGKKLEGVLPGFRVALKSDYQLERCKKRTDFYFLLLVRSSYM